MLKSSKTNTIDYSLLRSKNEPCLVRKQSFAYFPLFSPVSMRVYFMRFDITPGVRVNFLSENLPLPTNSMET